MKMMVQGSIALAQLLINRPYYLAWGTLPTGDPAWTDNPPEIDDSLTSIPHEVGRRIATEQKYVVQDPNGTYTVEGLKWAESLEPTNNILLGFSFESSDNTTDTLYRVGLFIGTIPTPSMAAFSSSVSNTGGYPAGATLIKLGSITTGSINSLMPNPNVGPYGGREITIGAQKVRVRAINQGTNEITITPLPQAVGNGTIISAPSTVAVPAGQEYLTPDQLLDPGMLFLGENRPPMFRSVSTREKFEIILSL